MVKLANVLHCRHFHVTFVNTEYNHRRRLVRSRGPAAGAGLPGFRFATIPDGLPDVVPPVTCVVADNVMSFSLDAAREAGVPCALFWTASACGYMGYRHFQFLIDEGLAPLKDEEQLRNGCLDTPVGWARGVSKHMRLRDFPTFIYTMRRGDVLLDFMMRELTALDAMRAILPPPVYTIGPLSLLLERLAAAAADLASLPPVPILLCATPLCTATSTSHGTSAPHYELNQLSVYMYLTYTSPTIRWLDGWPTRSVVYVNYGCITTMSNEELVEFAWGLAGRGYDFLWIIRPDLVKGETAVLPPDWCEQEAVGVFLTHAGWNSTMESLCAGVSVLSVLCWPFFAEQQTNCRYACAEWGALEARIRKAMAGEKGREMRRRAGEWKDATVRATQPGGRALTNLDDLIRDVLLPSKSS
uniref:Glycosyltransferase n=1 Tax=Setaria italica TaxID=4555 RepID=K3YYX1_SETIT